MGLLLPGQVTAHEVFEEDSVGATFELGDRGLCMTFLSNQVRLCMSTWHVASRICAG
jgi:hypothetical protein